MDFISQALPGFALDVLRVAVWLTLLMALFIPLERLAGLHRLPVFRPGFAIDIGYLLINSLLPKLLLILPTSLLAWLLHSLVPPGIEAHVAALPFGLRLLGALVVGELGFYWGHRWCHEIPFLWRFHAIHHSAEQIDWLVNTRAHPLDMVFTRLCGFVPMYVLGLAQPFSNRVDLVPVLVIIIGTLWGYFIHSNLRWRFGWLEQVVSTPAFHHWHHTNDAMRNRNYSTMLPWMDRVFGTFHMPRKEWPSVYGIDTTLAPGLGGQLLEPLLPVRRNPAAAEPLGPKTLPSHNSN